MKQKIEDKIVKHFLSISVTIWTLQFIELYLFHTYKFATLYLMLIMYFCISDT